jgi:hypothetical protein
MLTLCACATTPLGPSVMVVPTQGKSFDAFQQDDAVCRKYAGQQSSQDRYNSDYTQCMYTKGNGVSTPQGYTGNALVPNFSISPGSPRGPTGVTQQVPDEAPQQPSYQPSAPARVSTQADQCVQYLSDGSVKYHPCAPPPTAAEMQAYKEEQRRKEEAKEQALEQKREEEEAANTQHRRAAWIALPEAEKQQQCKAECRPKETACHNQNTDHGWATIWTNGASLGSLMKADMTSTNCSQVYNSCLNSCSAGP